VNNSLSSNHQMDMIAVLPMKNCMSPQIFRILARIDEEIQ